jgi:hypothetical protein
MGPIGCPKTSVKNCHLQAGDYEVVDLSVHTNIPKEQNDMEEMCSSGLDRGCTNSKFCASGVFCRSSERNLLHVTLLAPKILLGGS